MGHVVAAFSEDQAEKLTGITKSQLRYWDNTGFYRPTYVEDNRRVAFSRVYSFKDIVALRVLNVLRNQYQVSLQHLRDVSAKLSGLDNNPDRWIGTKLYPLNGRVIWYAPGSKLPEEVTSGQYVVAVVLDEIVQETKQAIDRLYVPRDKAKHGRIKRSRFVQHNAPVLAGTRIPVNAVKRFSKAGYSIEQIIKEYPDLTEEDVRAALKYRKTSAA